MTKKILDGFRIKERTVEIFFDIEKVHDKELIGERLIKERVGE